MNGIFSKKSFDKINDFLFDRQIKKRFKPNKKQINKLYHCQHCGKKIPKGLLNASFDVDGNGNISNVSCIECDREYEKIKEQRRKKICPFGNYGDNISYCINECSTTEQCYGLSIQNYAKSKLQEKRNKPKEEAKQTLINK